MKLFNITVFTAALALTTGVALAEDAEPPEFEEADANSDKSIDANEYTKVTATGVKKTLDEIDVNKDGKISATEYEVILEAECE